MRLCAAHSAVRALALCARGRRISDPNPVDVIVVVVVVQGGIGRETRLMAKIMPETIHQLEPLLTAAGENCSSELQS